MDIEIWKDVVEFEEIYSVSNFGRVKVLPKRTFVSIKDRVGHWRHKPAKIMKQTILDKGRRTLTLYKDGRTWIVYVHRLVAMAFMPNPENKPQVNHIDGDPSNNKVNNLEWATAKENAIHAHAIGLIRVRVGEETNCVKLNEAQVQEIRTQGLPARAAMAKYGVSACCIFDIRRRTTWKHVP